MQVIEKVKVVPEGYNGAGMNYDGGNRRDVNGKANAGLTLGIIGTALGAWALFGNRRSSVLGGAGGGMLGDGSTNINVLGATAGSGSGAPTAFQAWEKSCEVTLPNEPTVTGLVGRNAYGCLPCGFTQPASGTPAQ